jgi:23S rRNA (adenine-N6)-dimethyltransferase
LGWHRLDPEWAARIVAAAAVRPGELVVDIGAGEGALTAPLLAAGARVIAVEVHAGRVAHLRSRFAGAAVTVVQADAASLRLPRRPFRVVASPPYAISSALVRLLLRSPRLYAADLVLQRAVVARCVAGAGRWSRYELAIGLAVPRSAFRPVPRVDSAVLVVRRPGRAPGRSDHNPHRRVR